jgi:hypothetical protein
LPEYRDCGARPSAGYFCRTGTGSQTMPANLASFAIHVDDIDRARAFYEAVFG